ncbi:NAD(P)/FAD-dependent oxidoreductase [Paenibacillus sp. OV219]|uniref:NAD(P)/FAD-dependent oxidoreductase n=1 Tax=Paenibacillus sp. OV219 TaxID=1884377 RepID=UPI0008D8CDA7|nr:FAD-dependent oxidoreductase [Paenibacillus sp. OV219]SEN80908.1 glycerol-3-phosphate dehydrogenase [Paenibacillus sp. OV219]
MEPHLVKDVVVIGGGVVGSAILHALSFYQLDLLLIEKQPDICEGTSKANSGIIHTGFDAKPGTIEADCLRRSQELWPDLIANLRIPFLPCGAVMVARNEEEKEVIVQKYIPNAAANGVEVQWLGKEELLEANPGLTGEAIGGLLVMNEGICDPFWTTRAFAERAVLNGAELTLSNGVVSIEMRDSTQSLDVSRFRVHLEDGSFIDASYIVNAAGLWSDEIARMIGDDSFTITPRKGQFILTEDPLPISQIVLPVPNAKSKGILVAPVVFGGFLLGPTAEDQEDKWDRSTSNEGLESVLAGCEKLLPDSRSYSSIRQFAGVRAACSEGDFVIRPSSKSKAMIHAAGIRSTGISSSPGIAQLVLEQLSLSGLSLQPNSEAGQELPDLFVEDNESGSGEIVCYCRSVTRGEIANALHRPVEALTIDGIKRRTGAMLGECQGNCCIPKIMDMFVEHKNDQHPWQPLKGIRRSYVALKEGN